VGLILFSIAAMEDSLGVVVEGQEGEVMGQQKSLYARVMSCAVLWRGIAATRWAGDRHRCCDNSGAGGIILKILFISLSFRKTVKYEQDEGGVQLGGGGGCFGAGGDEFGARQNCAGSRPGAPSEQLAWAACGALRAIRRVRDGGRGERQSSVLLAGGSRPPESLHHAHLFLVQWR
jgi:hypothetical protein